MKGLDTTRVLTVMRKELLDYRRTRAIVVTMMIFPFFFLVEPSSRSLSPRPPDRVRPW